MPFAKWRPFCLGLNVLTGFVVAIVVKFYCFTNPLVPKLQGQISDHSVDYQSYLSIADSHY